MNTATTTFEVDVVPLAASKGEREYQAFLRQLPQLLATHAGKYVAIHDGNVIDADTDEIALILRVHAHIGYVPIHVALVTKERLPVRVPHYREQCAPEGL